MGHVLLHSHLCLAEQTLLLVDLVYRLGKLLVQVLHHGEELLAIFHGGVVLHLVAVDKDLGLLLHEDRVVPEIVGKLLVVATPLGVDVVVELGQVGLVDVLSIVFEQRSHHLAVEGGIPCVAVVVEHGILLLGLSLGVLHGDETLCEVYGTRCQLVCAAEGLVEEQHVLHVFVTVGIEVAEVLDVESALEEARRVLIMLDLSLIVALHLHDAHRVDTLVHADRVFPVVGALRIFRVVLDAHSLAGTHVTQHDSLLHAAHLGTGSVLCVAHLLDAVA